MSLRAEIAEQPKVVQRLRDHGWPNARTQRKGLARGYDRRLAALVEDAVVLTSPVSEALSPIAPSVAAQHVAAHVARRHGRDPERPGGLAMVARTV